jgi:probable phosphoglycerate mutase
VIVLVRHGETAPNRERRLLGLSDPPLTEVGRGQAQAVAKVLAHRDPAAVVSSPLSRCLETAGFVASACGVDVETDERLVEFDFGEFDGIALSEIPSDVMASLRHDPTYVAPGGECLMDVVGRMETWCREAFDRYAGDVVIAVTHVSPVKAAATWALGVPPTTAWRMFVDLASISRVGGHSDAPVLLSFNERGHLR